LELPEISRHELPEESHAVVMLSSRVSHDSAHPWHLTAGQGVKDGVTHLLAGPQLLVWLEQACWLEWACKYMQAAHMSVCGIMAKAPRECAANLKGAVLRNAQPDVTPLLRKYCQPGLNVKPLLP
jgi:hypothetical protein